MIQIQNSKQYDLEERTFKFALQCRDLVKTLPKTLTNTEYGRQLSRSSGSVGANYIEANESLSKKDFRMRVMICRKEVKESRYWLNLVEHETELKLKAQLVNESTELMKIFGSILENSK